MKNIFRILMAVAVLFTASCAKEDISSSIVGGGEVEMTFTVDLPELGTRAYADGTKATTLRYYVYEGNNYLPAISSESLPNGIVTLNGGKATVTLNLLKGMTYNIIFWADNGGSFYSYDPGTKSITVHYTGAIANDDNRDAFYKYVPAIDPATATKEDTKIFLTRPFGQLNVATSDLATVEDNEVVLTTSSVTVNTFKTLNLTNGQVSVPVDVTFAAKPMPCTLTPDIETLPNKPGYTYLSMNYLLPGTVNAEFTFKGKRNNGNGSEITFSGTTYTNVPVQANYRTNILGALLTKPTEFNVEIIPGFGGEKEYKVVEVANVAEFKTAFENANVEGANTEISISDNINLSDLITRAANNLTITAKNANLVINGNGYTLTYEGQDRAIDVTNGAENTNLTLKNVTIDCVASYCQRGVNYNTNGALTLEGVTIKGKNVTYALNLPGSSDNAKVEIIDSKLTGNIALNLWGEKMVVNAKDSFFTSVDNSTAEGYAAISLNNDGQGNSATGTIVNIVGGKIIALDENGVEATAIRIETDAKVNVSDETEVVGNRVQDVAIVTYKGTTDYYSFSSLKAAIEKAKDGPNVDCIRLIADVTSSEIIVLDFPVTLDGAGKTLTSTAARAINVSGADGVTIKNLTINASGERAINVIQNATNVTIEKVTATSANYTVNVASSAPNAVVAIKENSTLNGLCTVNVSAAGALVTIDNSVVNCNDNNTTAGEAYAALSLNKEAVGGSIIATNTTVNVAEGSDSSIARNSAPNGTVTINGSDKDVNVMVAFVTYPNSDYYYSFTTLQAAIDWVAKNGEGNIEVIRTIVIDEDVEIDLKGQTVTAPASSAFEAQAGGKLTIKNGKVKAHEAIVRAIGGEVIIESGEYTQTGTAVGSTPATYRYAIDCRENGKITINGGTFESGNGMINVGSEVIINGGKFENIVEKTMTRHFAYVSALLTINDGEFYGKANSSAGGCFFCGAASSGRIQVNGGKFTSLWTSGSVNRIFESYSSGSAINVTGGLFNTNGGIATFVTNNTDDATKAAYPYVAK